MQTRREIIKGGLGLSAIIAAGKAPAALVRSMVAARTAAWSGKPLPYDAEVEYIHVVRDAFRLAYVGKGLAGIEADVNLGSLNGTPVGTFQWSPSGSLISDVHQWVPYSRIIDWGVTQRVTYTGDIKTGQWMTLKILDRSFYFGERISSCGNGCARSDIVQDVSIGRTIGDSTPEFCTDTKFRAPFYVYSNEVVVASYVPVRVGNEAMLYDKISKSLIRSYREGAGVSCGPDKTI